MPHATADDGTRLAYEVEGDGPALVLLHGITEDRRLWEPVVAALRAGFACVRMDARGHGESEPARTDYEPATMASDVGAVVEDAALAAPPVLVGHSMGAVMATAYAAIGAGPLRAVVNVDQSLRLPDLAALVRPLEADLRGPGFEAVMDLVADALGVDVLAPEVADRVRAHGRSARSDVVLGVWRPLFESSDEELAALVETELLTRVKVPYLAIHGSDPGAGYEAWLTGRVPTAVLEVWDGHGHWLHLADPERFAGRVREFVAAL